MLEVVLLLENVVDVDDVVEVIVELTELEVVDEMDVVDVKVLPSSRIPKVGQILNLHPDQPRVESDCNVQAGADLELFAQLSR